MKLAELKCEDCHGPHGASDTLRPYEENRISGYSRDIWGGSISGLRNVRAGTARQSAELAIERELARPATVR